MKNILVTGGAGFIGSNLTLELQNRYPDASLMVLDDFRATCFKNLLGFRGDVLAYSVADKSWMEALKNRPVDNVFHLASITDTTVLDEKKMMFDNVEGFRNILEFALQKKADVVYASSAAVYGSQDTPMKEEDGGRPNNIYGFSKWVMENLAKTYEGKLKVVGLRYFNVFGPREFFKDKAASMTYQLYRQMVAGNRPRIFKYGEQKRDFIYVKDIVEATIRAREAKKNTVLNVGTGRATSFNEVIDAINEALGTHHKPDYFDNPFDFYQNFTQADMSHHEKMTGFKCRYSTREGIIDYVRNYLLPNRETVPAQKA
ncbi:MAG: ADP-glyceromanno-heptose 6-epimerase [Candidatus Omnitrophica bacterium]|nr:ADP-glyceromanno-heptose 6-epimerase [Candidatus Omnitrophota bacterium]MDD5670124.1 ADP-glyceromanno-heptose 6-epimerase [Candidatus Omnitrophota bacterium]